MRLTLFIIILIFLILFMLYLIYKNSRFNNFTNKYKYDINTDKPTIIVGSSEYVMSKIDDLKRLKKTGKYQFIAHGTCILKFYDIFGFYPDYFIMYDIDMCSKFSKWNEVFIEKKLTKLIAYDFWWNKFENIKLRTNVMSSKKNFENYRKKYLDDSNKIILPSKVIDHAYKDKICEIEKFNDKYINIQICSIDKNNKNIGVKKEKLSLHIIPLIIFLRFKKVYIVGFDCKGSRINEISSKSFLDECKYIRYHLPPLIKETKKRNIELYNLIEDENTNLKEFIPYKNIKELD